MDRQYYVRNLLYMLSYESTQGLEQGLSPSFVEPCIVWPYILTICKFHVDISIAGWCPLIEHVINYARSSIILC